MSQTIHALDLGFCISYFGTKPKPKESVKYKTVQLLTNPL